LHSHAYALPPWFGIGLLLGVCGAALWKGRAEERLAAGGMLLAVAVTYFLRDPRWSGTQWAGFVADIALLGLLIALSLRTPKYWPLFAAAFQLLAVVTHTARMLDRTLGAWAYATAGVIFTQLVLVSIAVGTWNAWRSRYPAIADDPTPIPGATRR
jgi:uncharacterized membrane protein